MSEYIALMRGVNVGGRIIKMADLKTCFEHTGLKNVRTVLQSGNVLFESPASDGSVLRQNIETAVTKQFKYPAIVFVYSQADMLQMVELCPFEDSDKNFHTYLVLLEPGVGEELIKEPFKLAKNEQVSLGKNVIYWRVSKGMTLKSEFSKYLSKSKYKDFNTNRNLNTIKKLI